MSARHTYGGPKAHPISAEDEYLEAIYVRQESGVKRARTSELSSDLNISAPSVTEMLKKLQKKGLVDYDPYVGARLTKKGKQSALHIVRRHRLAERLLSDVLGLDLSKVHEEACKLEHVLDNSVLERIHGLLKETNTCPHGNPIPSEGGKVAESESIKLTKADEVGRYTVCSIPEEREAIQRLLPHNVLPGSRIKVVEKLPSGALMIQRGGTQLAVSQDIASKILVREHDKHKARRRRRRGARR